MATDSKRPKLSIRHLLKPHTTGLAIGVAAVLVEGVASLAEPWPLKIVLDNVLKSKPGSGGLSRAILLMAGADKLAILKFAALAVLVIAAIGAAATYTERYLTTRIGQYVMHDLRQTLYSHIQRLSLDYHDRKHTGDLISRLTSDIDAHPELHCLRPSGRDDQQSHAGRHDGRYVLPQLAVHPDRAVRGANPVRRGVPLHPPHQERLARSSEKRRRDGLRDPGGAVFHSGGKGLRARRI